MEKHARRLNARQERFVTAYLACGRVVQAARMAGYSEATASHSAGRLLRAPPIKAALAAGRAMAERTGAALRDRVVRELESIAFAPPDGETVRTADKVRALDLLGRMAERAIEKAQAQPLRERLAPSSEERAVDPSAPAPSAADSSAVAPSAVSWQEKMRRGMERVERGRRADEERRRRERAGVDALSPAPAPETVMASTDTATKQKGSGLSWRHARCPAFFPMENGEVCTLPLPEPVHFRPHTLSVERPSPSPPSPCVPDPLDPKGVRLENGVALTPAVPRGRPVPMQIERHPESPFPLHTTYADLQEVANRTYDPWDCL